MLLTFHHETENDLNEEWQRRPGGKEERRSELWQDLRLTLSKECRLLSELNVKLADEELKQASQNWQDWLTQEEMPKMDDPRAGALATAVHKGLPMVPVVKAVSQALDLAQQ